METSVRREYRTRPVRYLKTLESGGWRMKLYGISADGQKPRPELLQAAEEVAFETLPKPLGEGRYGVGFVIAHDGADGCYVLVDWWQGEDMLYHHLYLAPKARPKDLERHTSSGLTACVWELAVISFERQSWVDAVLNNPEGPDLEGYLECRLSTRV